MPGKSITRARSASGRFLKAATQEAKKRARRRVATKIASRKANPALAVVNPGAVGELLELAAAGFAGYAATRFVSRITFVQLSKRRSRWAKQGAIGASAATTAGIWLAASKIDALNAYQEQLVIGSSIATLQAVVQHFLPKFGWIVSDYSKADLAGKPRRSVPVARVGGAAAPAIEDEYEDEVAAAPESAAAADEYEEDEYEDDAGSLSGGGFGGGLGDLGDDAADGLGPN